MRKCRALEEVGLFGFDTYASGWLYKIDKCSTFSDEEEEEEERTPSIFYSIDFLPPGMWRQIVRRYSHCLSCGYEYKYEYEYDYKAEDYDAYEHDDSSDDDVYDD